MKTLILANGDFPISDELYQISQTADCLIAADGGARHATNLSRIPDVLVGDLDSIPTALLDQFGKKEVKISRYSTRKDQTDLELAVDQALALDSTEIFLAGLLGGRWDMTLGNILLLAQKKYDKINFTVLGDGSVWKILRRGTHHLQTRCGTGVSLLPLSAVVENISLSGLEYPLVGESLHLGTSRGLSNVSTGTSVDISFASGVLLVIIGTE